MMHARSLFADTPPCFGVPLSAAERAALVVAVQSVFLKLAQLYARARPLFADFGFTPPSPGVMARDLSEHIETAIVQHCASFTRGRGSCDLARGSEDWEVKISQAHGLTINQSKRVAGETYLVSNYDASDLRVRRVFVLWRAADALFSPRRANSNARALHWKRAVDAGHVELLT